MFKLWLRRLLALPIALFLIFQEWGWRPLAEQLAKLARWPVWFRLQERIKRLPPYAALAIFLLPSILLLPAKLGALWLIAHGKRLLGVLVIIAAKVVGTAIVAWLFNLVQPQLMQLPWFARLFARWKTWKDGWLDYLRATWAWRYARVVKHRTKRSIAALRDWVKRLIGSKST
jgi:hypothetical protein